MADFWLRFSVHFRPWLKELTRQYMEHNPMPPYACWILPSYYTDKDDREVAAMVGMLIKSDAQVYERCRAVRITIGEHPFAWFRDRGFVTLGFANVRNRLTGGVRYYRIANALSVLWEGRRREGRWIPEATSVDDKRARMARMSLLESHDTLCPLTDGVCELLHTFWPDYRRFGDCDKAIHLFGLDRDCDFFYAALAWEDFQRRSPAESSRLVTVYHKRYKESNLLREYFWTGEREGILPKIN